MLESALHSAAVIAAALAFSWLVQAVGDIFTRPHHRWQHAVRLRLGLAERKRFGEAIWLTLLLQLALWFAALYLLLGIWQEFPRLAQLRDALAGDGVAIGALRIVPADLLRALLMLVVLVILVRWLQERLERGALSRAYIEPSTRESLATLFGYIGIAIAVIVALQTAGLRMSTLAWVAGGLSVGIGFGLREIFNNLASGVILLFEKPVRTGDYIVMGKTEGFVRKIRIRSTELEDWNRESIIVPNSALLQNDVHNLNLRDDYGRIILPLRVAYGTDPERVRELLIDVASAHRETLGEGDVPSVPGPVVLLQDFADIGLVFELRVFIRDVTRRVVVASDLRFAIDAAFREAGIVMPVPQRDVRLRREALPPSAASPTKD